LQYFKTKPYACDPSSLPKYPPSKEFDVKRRDDDSRRFHFILDTKIHILVHMTGLFWCKELTTKVNFPWKQATSNFQIFFLIFYYVNYYFPSKSLFALEIDTNPYVPSRPNFVCGNPIAFKFGKMGMPAWIIISPYILLSVTRIK
jgi:hypothetical protein